MKPYGEKRNKRTKPPHGDGCFLCTQERKTTKTAVRAKVKKEVEEQMVFIPDVCFVTCEECGHNYDGNRLGYCNFCESMDRR
jgi:hypothetical protein